MDFKEEVERTGYTFVGIERKGYQIKYKYICPNGHKGAIRKDHWNRGVRCAKCAGNARLTIEDIRSDFEKENYRLLTKKYINSKQLLVTMCPEGHIYKVSRNNWTQGYRCSTCSGRAKNNLYKVKKSIEDDNYILNSKQYINNKTKLSLVCPNNHKYEVSWDNWYTKNSRCPKCNNWGTSIQEKELCDFIMSLGHDVKRFDRQLIAPYELDILVPDKKIAIEYCGLYWHSELMGKDRNYHINKKRLCNEAGYELITIFEDELVSKKEIVLSRLKSIVGCNNLTSVYGRNCIIKEIDAKVAIDFCNNNHLQGYGHGASVRIGAFYNNELISVMTFSKPSLSKGNKKVENGIWELSRFCSKIEHKVIGVASKLLAYFTRNYVWRKIFSYADMRWSNGNMYEKIGFHLDNVTKPNYWYFKNNRVKLHRFALRKRSDEPKDVTEWELRKSQGWNRIWDCGNLKFILEKDVQCNEHASVC